MNYYQNVRRIKCEKPISHVLDAVGEDRKRKVDELCHIVGVSRGTPRDDRNMHHVFVTMLLEISARIN